MYVITNNFLEKKGEAMFQVSYIIRLDYKQRPYKYLCDLYSELLSHKSHKSHKSFFMITFKFYMKLLKYINDSTFSINY